MNRVISTLRFIRLLTCLLMGLMGYAQGLTIDVKKINHPVFKAYPVLETKASFTDILKVVMIQDSIESTTPLLGNYTKVKDTLVFEPYFSLGEDLEFSVYFFDNSKTIHKKYLTTQRDKTIIKQVMVDDVYPRTNKIPQNILTFHVQFSEPMEQDEMAFRHIHLYNEKREIIPHVWYNKSRWVSSKELILMIHPGRIKKGISYYENLGNIFSTNQKYFLEITDSLKTLNPNHKIIPFIKEITVVKPINKSPRVKVNKFISPRRYSNDKLKFVFNTNMDYLSILNGVSIKRKSSNDDVKGVFEAGVNDAEWYFAPNEEWTEESYIIVFNKYVSDICGNNLMNSFESKCLKIKKKQEKKIKFLLVKNE